MPNSINKLLARISVLPMLLIPNSAMAAVDTGLTGAGTNLTKVQGTGTALLANNLPKLIGNITNVFLGVLGIIFLVFVVYAGYLYLMAMDDAKHVDKAKKMLGNAVIGIILVMAAYAISTFVIDAISKASTG